MERRARTKNGRFLSEDGSALRSLLFLLLVAIGVGAAGAGAIGVGSAHAASDAPELASGAGRATLNLEPLRNLTVRLVRAMPGATAEGHLMLDLSNEGAIEVRQLTVGVDPVVDKEKRRLLTARLEPTLASSVEGAAAVAARGTRKLFVRLSGFDEPGTFQTAVVLQSEDLPSVQRIPLTIEVTDAPLFPMLVIALGVGLAFVVSQAAQRWRPREEHLYRAAQLRADLERWRRLGTESARTTIDQLADTLARAEERSQYGALDAARAMLEEVERGLEEHRKRHYEMRAAAQRGMEQVEAQSAMLESMRTELPSEAQQELDAIESGMREARAMLAQQAVEAALTQGQKLQSMASALMKSMPVKSGPTRGLEPLAMEAGSGSLPSRSGLASQPPAASQPLTLSVVEPPELCTADSELTLQLGGELPSFDEVVWEFDDGEVPLRTPSRKTVMRRFLREGEHFIKASIRQSGEEVAKAILRLAILPRRSSRRLAQLRSSLRATDWALFMIALVLATLSGWITLCDGKVFGTGASYIAAFFWGFGIDSSVRGISDVFKRATTA